MGRANLQMPGNAAKNVCFDQELISRYGGRGPRYTSYPTALQFDESLTVEKYKQAARLSNESGRPLSLYIHIPFCESLCYYCACNKIVNIEQLCDLMTHIAGSFKLDHSERREFSIEVDPRTVDAATIEVLADLGFNRLSLGIQDFDPDVQQAVNRVQSVQDVADLVDQSRAVDFKSVSFDLIYGLPHQTDESFDRTLDEVIAMKPDRLAVYNYAHLPARFKGQRMIDEEELPLPETKLKILHQTITKLTEAGYVYIGMDHFALPEDELVKAQNHHTLQRNFQGYSTHRECDLIGLGASAIGSIDNCFAQNTPTTMEYEALVEAGSLPVKRGIEVDADDRLRAKVIQELMCHDQLVFAEFGKKNDVDFEDYFAPELARLEPLVDDGLVLLGPEGIQITPKGRLLLRSIAMTFDRYLAEDTNDGRFSKAI
jgi:oxygen-independent coproporphyrinogen-3 oxidase